MLFKVTKNILWYVLYNDVFHKDKIENLFEPLNLWQNVENIYFVANVEEYHNEPFGRYGQLPRF